MHPRRPPKILILFSATFLCSFLGVISDPVQMPHYQVNGMLGGSVLLPVRNISSSEKVEKIEWDFQPQPGTGLFIAEFRDGRLERPYPGDRFGLRLELADETTLRIRNLEKEDGGVYKARVRLHPANFQEHPFHLKVYEPVPVPQVLHRESSNSSSGCNVTLECWVSEKAGLNVSWRIGDALRPLEEYSDWYHLSSDGWCLHMYRWSIPLDSNFTCLVSNPASQKSTSFDLLSICSRKDSSGGMSLWWLVFPILGILVVAGISMWMWKKRKKWCTGRADSTVSIKSNPELQYSQVTSQRSPPEGNIDQELTHLSEQSSLSTVYAKVQPRTPLSDPVC